MDLHELTTAQRKLAQQQLKDIQKGGKKKVQNASDKYSDKYFNANTTNKAMAAGRAKDKSLAAAADERVKSCLLYTSPSPRDYAASRMPSSA